jgi:membrane fusion protein (multidrug efflux system)
MTPAKHVLENSVTKTADVKMADGIREAPLVTRNPLRPYLALGLVVILGLAGYLLLHLLTGGRQNTDDAQVSADMVPVSARVGGVVVSVPVSDNQAVRQGDLLAQIDPIDYENKVKQAEAELRAAQAQASGAQAQTRIVAASSKGGLSTARAALSGTAASVAGADAQVGATQAMLTKAEADAQNTDNELRRAQVLRKGDAIAEAQVDALKSQAAVMHAVVTQARAQVAVAQEGKNSARIRIAEAAGRVEQSAPVDAQVDVAKANADLAVARAAAAEVALAQARLNLSYTRVLAPRDGHISRLAARRGQLLQPAQLVTNLIPDTTYLVANFKETQVGEMRPGQRAEVAIDALPGRTFHARVESVALGTSAQFSMIPPDNASGNFVKVVQRVPVKLAWTDLPPDVHLAAGLSADVTVLLK